MTYLRKRSFELPRFPWPVMLRQCILAKAHVSVARARRKFPRSEHNFSRSTGALLRCEAAQLEDVCLLGESVYEHSKCYIYPIRTKI